MTLADIQPRAIIDMLVSMGRTSNVVEERTNRPSFFLGRGVVVVGVRSQVNGTGLAVVNIQLKLMSISFLSCDPAPSHPIGLP